MRRTHFLELKNIVTAAIIQIVAAACKVTRPQGNG